LEGVFIILSIDKQEAMYMRARGYEDCVKKTHTRKINYYLVEQPDKVDFDSNGNRKLIKKGALRVLHEYRQSLIAQKK
jgi:hypothetical protein